MNELNGFKIETYNQFGFPDNAKTFTCPECSHTRKKKTDKCLLINWDNGIANCFHCGTMLQLHTYAKKEVEKHYEVPKFVYNKLDDKVKKWFKGRGISEQTLSQAKVTQSKEWMPQTSKEENTICFNYFLDNEIVNIKYRDGRKNFKLYKGAEKIFYNIDSIRTSKECIIVEGEIDALSFIEAGYYHVVSVPNGFNLQGNVNLDYLDNYLNYFDNKEKIYLCLDNDEAGRKGRDEFLQRLGIENCFLIDLNDCKDANEYLVKHGKENLLEAIKNAKQPPLENVKTINDFSEEIDNFWINGLPKGMLIGNQHFDNVFSAEMGQYTLITGVPQSGKSEWLDQLLVKYNFRTGNKIGIVSIENEPFVFHYDKIAQKIFGRVPNENDMGTQDLIELKNYISENYFHVHFEKRYYLEDVLKKFKELRKRKGCKIFVIDPFNKVKLKENISNINEYTSEYHLQLDAFVKETNSHLFLVVHPTKSNYAEGSNKSYVMPGAYDIKGGGEHFDMSYNVLGVNRVYEQKIIHIKTLKVKFKHLGTPQESVFFGYNTINGRYENLKYQPQNIDFQTVVEVDKLDYSNWLKPVKETEKQPKITPNTEFDKITEEEVAILYNDKEKNCPF